MLRQWFTPASTVEELFDRLEKDKNPNGELDLAIKKLWEEEGELTDKEREALKGFKETSEKAIRVAIFWW